jgi:hypothetical protein
MVVMEARWLRKISHILCASSQKKCQSLLQEMETIEIEKLLNFEE